LPGCITATARDTRRTISATAGLSALSLAGRDDARLYDGSLAGWSARPGLPLAAGWGA